MARYEYKTVTVDSFDLPKKVEQATIEWAAKGWRAVQIVHPRHGAYFILVERKKRFWRRRK
jgi:hypothetical protein